MDHLDLYRRKKVKRRLVLLCCVAALSGCSLHSHYSPAKPARMSDLWEDPKDLEQRNLFYGPGGPENYPDTTAKFKFKSMKLTGTQPGYDVIDSKGQEWSVKLSTEARVEVTLSRIVWAVGYHQPSTYYVTRWIRSKDGADTLEHPARFRLEPKEMEKTGEWAFHDNPFTGTRPLNGLWVLMVMFNNWDIKPAQNTIYTVKDASGATRQLYVARDLGAALGKTAWIRMATKDDPAGFESEPFIDGVVNNRVVFHYKGSWLEPQVHTIAEPGDVKWISRLLSRLSDQQWKDAFRAGGFTEEESARYIARMKQKIDEGLKLGWY
jgi:hypothetical protein